MCETRRGKFVLISVSFRGYRYCLSANLIIGIIIALSCIAGVLFRSAAVEVVCLLCEAAWVILRNNQMMTYVERRAFRPDEKK